MLKFKLSIIVLITIIATGCTPLFVREDKQMILNNNSSDNNHMVNRDNSKELLIENINSNLLNGLVYDISNDGKQLLVSSSSTETNGDVESSSNYFNLHTFNLKSNQLKQVLVSAREQTSAKFDNKNKSMLYVEYSSDDKGKLLSDSFRLNWTDTDGNTTKNISQSDESVSPKFSVVDDELLIYGNSDGEINLVKTKDIPKETIPKDSYKLTKKLNIYKIDYYQDYNLSFFLAVNPKTNALDLYYAVLDSNEVEPTLLETNVTGFDISRKNKSVLYNVSKDNVNQLICIDMHYNKQIIYDGPVSLFHYIPSEEKIVFSEKIEDSSNLQNLWIINSDGSDKSQLASNLRIACDNLVFDPNNNIIYFTVYQLNEGDPNVPNYNVYMLEFSYRKKATS